MVLTAYVCMNQIVHARIEAMGWVGQCYAPREVVAERSWRLEEEDGTYVVLLQSTNKYMTESEPSKSQGPLAWMRTPVRAQVRSRQLLITVHVVDNWFRQDLLLF